MSDTKPQTKPEKPTESPTTQETSAQDTQAQETPAQGSGEFTEQDLKKLADMTRNLLNPNGQNPQVDQYIDSTFSYLLNVYTKLTTAQDKDAAAKEISNDLVKKLENWANSKKEQKEKDESKDEKKDEKKDELVNEDVD